LFWGIQLSQSGNGIMEAIGSIFETFHSLSLLVIILLVALTLGVCVMMVGVFRGDFDNSNNQF